MKSKPGISTALEANRQGNLTPDQENRLRNEITQRSIIAWVIISAAVAAAVFFILVAFSSASGGVYALLVVPLLAGIILGAYFYSQWQWENLRIDLMKGSVKSITGKISLDIQGNSQGVAFFVRLGSFRWPLTKVEFLSLHDGELHRIYYAPRSKTLLSSERLDDFQDLPAGTPESVEKGKHQQYTLSGDGELIEVSNDEPAQLSNHQQQTE